MFNRKPKHWLFRAVALRSWIPAPLARDARFADITFTDEDRSIYVNARNQREALIQAVKQFRKLGFDESTIIEVTGKYCRCHPDQEDILESDEGYVFIRGPQRFWQHK